MPAVLSPDAFAGWQSPFPFCPGPPAPIVFAVGCPPGLQYAHNPTAGTFPLFAAVLPGSATDSSSILSGKSYRWESSSIICSGVVSSRSAMDPNSSFFPQAVHSSRHPSSRVIHLFMQTPPPAILYGSREKNIPAVKLKNWRPLHESAAPDRPAGPAAAADALRNL